jgi:dihydrofolate reductase
MKISIIVAIADTGVIGHNNELPWRLSSDLQRFKKLTMGHHLLLGRKTFESIGGPLPGREMIVVSRGTPNLPDGVNLAPSVDSGIEQAQLEGEEELFVAGGASIYAATLTSCHRIYLTRVHTDIRGDVMFPKTDWSVWTEVSREGIVADDRNEHPSTFIVYDRRPS